MFCPKCGRPVNENANFCGGCGLSKREIEEQLSKQTAQVYAEPVFEKAPEKTGEVENFVEQPFPTDVEFKDVPNDVEEPVVPKAVVQAPPVYSQPQPQPQPQYPAPDTGISKEKSLSTIDFVWMMVFTSIPFFGLFYLIYLAFIQNDNINKRSYARAIFIIDLFCIALGFMFFVGFFVTSFI